MAMLHDVHTVTPATSSGGGASAHAQCQLRTIVVAPAGGAGTDGVASSVAQFQYQFQTKVCGTLDDVGTVIPFEFATVVLPVSRGVTAGVTGAACCAAG